MEILILDDNKIVYDKLKCDSVVLSGKLKDGTDFWGKYTDADIHNNNVEVNGCGINKGKLPK